MDPLIAIAHFKLGKLSGDDIVTLANSWLVDSIFTDSINYLAMETNPIRANVEPLLESAVEELDLSVPTKIEAAKILTKYTIENMVSGKTDLMKGAEFLYWEIHHEITDELPDDKYMGSNLNLESIFCWLREIWDCRDGSTIFYYTELPRAEAETRFLAHLKEESQLWLERHL